MEFLDLPDDVILTILSKSTYKEVCRTAQTCKKLRDLSYDNYLWCTLCEEKFNYLPKKA